MPAPRIDLSIDQGSTYNKTLTIIGSDGLPVSFANCTAEMMLRTSADAANAALTLSNGAGITLGSSNGVIELAISAAETAALEAGEYVYDLEVTTQAGAVTKYASGKAAVRREITR